MSFSYRREHKKAPKNKAMTLHTQIRFQERFGFPMTKEIRQNMIAQITKRRSQYVLSQSNNKTVHIVDVLGKPGLKAAVVYNKNKQLIHTVFPVEWLEDGSFQKHQEKLEFINNG